MAAFPAPDGAGTSPGAPLPSGLAAREAGADSGDSLASGRDFPSGRPWASCPVRSGLLSRPRAADASCGGTAGRPRGPHGLPAAAVATRPRGVLCHVRGAAPPPLPASGPARRPLARAEAAPAVPSGCGPLGPAAVAAALSGAASCRRPVPRVRAAASAEPEPAAWLLGRRT